MTDERHHVLQTLVDSAAHARPTSSRMAVICDQCVRQLAVSGAGATVLTEPANQNHRQDTQRALVHASNDTSAGLEELQLTVGEGPCLEAFATGGPVLVPDLAQARQRWPAFATQAQNLGAAAVFSFPLQVGVIRLGSLDCYRDQPGPLRAALLADAVILADLATSAIVAELDGHSSDDLDWLADPHAEIHQACGMVQVQLTAPAEQALLRLRAYAFAHNLALTDLARQVLHRQVRFHPDPHSQPDQGHPDA